MVVHISNPSTQGVEAGGLSSQPARAILSEFEVSLSFLVRPCHKKKRKGRERWGERRKGKEGREEAEGGIKREGERGREAYFNYFYSELLL